MSVFSTEPYRNVYKEEHYKKIDSMDWPLTDGQQKAMTNINRMNKIVKML